MEEDNKIIADFSKVAAMFEAAGVAVDEDVMELMAPLLNGEMTLEQHEAWLRAELEELTNAL